jgi:hypothetical protein
MYPAIIYLATMGTTNIGLRNNRLRNNGSLKKLDSETMGPVSVEYSTLNPTTMDTHNGLHNNGPHYIGLRKSDSVKIDPAAMYSVTIGPLTAD